ncbi:type II toxin-antitoxin system CcdA family antitoxin [Sphingomonas sp. NY01]|uniref:type II toxin-antitoxin system CcdA family antitoxin n=1 Tax=Sphingomonas sp. NY01 TaxID=2968057 RepID=UPI00315DF31E
MKHDPVPSGKREPVSLSLDTGVVAAARECGIDLATVSEYALRTATAAARAEQWQAEHRDWIEANNAWVEANGLPLAKYRLF